MMSDFERDYEITYHWSPSTRRAAIEREGLRIGVKPCVNGVEDDHRNEWISVSPTPSQAWWLSGEALCGGGFPSEAPEWDLYEVDVKGLSVDRRSCIDDYPELYVLENVPPDRVRWVARRRFNEDEDAALLALAEHRLAHDNGNRTSLADVARELGVDLT